MPKTSIICGVLLLLIGVAGYVIGVNSGNASVTALIPAFIGLVLVLLGMLAGMKENLRKHLMHAAIVVALLGFIATATRLIPRISELSATPAVLSQVSTALICLVFVILAIRSFAAARRQSSSN